MSTTVDLAAATDHLEFEFRESQDARRARMSSGALILVMGLLLAGLFFGTNGTANFALSDAFDEVQLPTIALPGAATVALCAVLCLLAGAGFVSGRLRGRLPAIAGVADRLSR